MKKGFKIIAASLCLSMLFTSTAFAEEGVGIDVNPLESVVNTDSEEVVEDTDYSSVYDVNAAAVSNPALTVSSEGNATYKITLDGYSCADGESLSVAVWGNTNGQNDLHWYPLASDGGVYSVEISAADHREFGDYYAHVYSDINGAKKYVTASSFNVEKTTKNSNASVNVSKEKNAYNINISNIDLSGAISNVRAAVWSEENGQDDLRFIDCIYDEAAKTAAGSYNASDFKSYGKYYVHIYASTFYGDNIFLGAGEYTVAKPSVGSMEATVDSDNGDFTITIKDLKNDNGIQSVSVPVWSKPDQSDIVWYTPSVDSDGNYVVKSNISKHKNNFGPYNAHLYIKDNNGVMNFVTGTSVKFSIKATVSANKDGNDYKLKATDISTPGTLKEISFAVWSEANRQSDLKWIGAAYNASTKSAENKLDMSSFSAYGKYFVHAYGTTASGDKVFLGGSEFKINKPTFTSFSTDSDEVTGKFKLSLNGLKSDAGISKVQIAVWSKADASNTVWYTAKDNGNGEYTVESDISMHKYAAGTYHAHVYITEKNNVKAFLDAADFDMKIKDDGITVTEVKDETIYNAAISKLTVPAGAKQVKFAVWSKAGGQDDFRWYTASGKNGGDYKAEINIKNHRTAGVYYIHAYVQTQSGEMVFADASEFSVNSSAKASVSGAKENDAEGKFRTVIKLSDATAPVEKVQVGVWSKNDASDMCWYDASKQSDGTYACVVNVVNHKLSLGNYNMHVYTTFANDIKSFSGAGTYNFNPSNFVGVYKPKNGERTLVLKNPAASYGNLRFGVWNGSEGAGSAHWYNAVRQSDGSYQVTFKTSDFSKEGTFYAHCYNGGSFIGSVPSFTVDKSEVMKNGFYYENGYVYYYINDVRQSDIRGIIGPQSTYKLMVNRTCNTVTVYTTYGNGGYVLPVCSFACSVGLPGTPTPAGSFRIVTGYRWKMLMGPSWGQYASGINASGIYFHSVAGVNATSYNLNAGEYNKLGSAASHGCIRLNVRDAKWIYDNCGLGTQVEIYDSLYAGPLGKPSTIKIPAGQTWDPTDPNI